MSFAAKVAWWGGSLLMAVCTRQIAFGMLPLAVHWHRRQMAQFSQMSQLRTDLTQTVDQQCQQVRQLLTQVQQTQADWGQKLTPDPASFRPQITPIVQEIHRLQQRLKRVELQTAPQVTDLSTQLDDLQTQVNALAQGVVLRQGVGVFIDGANLHASAHRLGVDLDYARLLPRLLPKDTPATAVHFYSGHDPDNLQQRRLYRDLHEMGMQIHTKPMTRFANGGTKANLDGEMIVDMVKSSFARVILLSGDGDFLPALETLADQGVHITVAAFASDTHRPLQTQFAFHDLRKICTVGGKVIPLPVKQTSSSVG